jgi:SAM-dependent methyltransferase
LPEADFFEAYGRAAASLSDPLISAGRHVFQREALARVPDDVAAKLRLAASDRLLEIGCGTGSLLRPLSQRVGEAVGVDHESCLAAIDPVPENLTLVPGRWPGAPVNGDFDKVLVYSVLHYLADAEQAVEFIDACVAVLRPDGWLMIGDLPNGDAAARFGATEYGRRFQREWAERVAGDLSPEKAASHEIFAQPAKLTPFVSDAFVATLFARYRGLGHEVYVLPQPPDLPFSHTREDVLVHVRP